MSLVGAEGFEPPTPCSQTKRPGVHLTQNRPFARSSMSSCSLSVRLFPGRSLGDGSLELRMVMPVDLHQYVDGHAQVPRDQRDIDAPAHEHGGAAMSEHMRAVVARSTRAFAHRGPRPAHLLDWPALVVDHERNPARVILSTPATQMRNKPLVYAGWG